MGAFRYSLTTRISSDGNTLTHGLPGTPDEYFVTLKGPGVLGGTVPYFIAVGSTSVQVACAVAGGSGVSATVFAAVNHSVIA